VLIRQLVNGKEWISACKSLPDVQASLDYRLWLAQGGERKASFESVYEPHRHTMCVCSSTALAPIDVCQQEWKEAAHALDEYLEFEEWKKVEEDPYYDYLLIKKVAGYPHTQQHKSY